jgi:hypothetical protein
LERVDRDIAKTLCEILIEKGWEGDYQTSYPVSDLYIYGDISQENLDTLKWYIERALFRENGDIGTWLPSISEEWLRKVLPRNKNAPRKVLIGGYELMAVKAKKHISVYAVPLK